jgi:hypothetical protein
VKLYGVVKQGDNNFNFCCRANHRSKWKTICNSRAQHKHYIFHPVSYKYTTCFGLRPSSYILTQKSTHMRKISSKHYHFLSCTKVIYSNKICVQKLKIF